MESVAKILGVILALGSSEYCAEMTQTKWEGLASYFEADRSFRAKYKEAYGEWLIDEPNSGREFRLENGVEVKASNRLLGLLFQTYEMKMPQAWEGVPLSHEYKSFQIGEASNDTLFLRQIYGEVCNLHFSHQDWNSMKFGLLFPQKQVKLGNGNYLMTDIHVNGQIPTLLENSLTREDKGLVVRLKTPQSRDQLAVFMASYQEEKLLAEFKIEPSQAFYLSEEEKQVIKPYIPQ